MSLSFEIGKPRTTFASAWNPPQEPSGPLFAADRDALLRWEGQSTAAEPFDLFQTAAWARLLGAYDRSIGREPLLLGPPEALGPGFILPVSVAREGAIRVARIIGEPLSEYSGAIGTVTAAGLRAGLARLRREHRADLLVLRRVRSQSALDRALDEIGAGTACAGGAPAFHLGPKGLLRNAHGGLAPAYRDAGRRRRRLKGKHGYRFEVFGAGHEAEEMARLALAWKADWVRERGLVSRVGSDKALGEAIAALYRSRDTGALMGVLFLDGEPVAVEGGFRSHGRFFAYTGAYRPDRRAEGVGKVAIAEMVEWCAAQGVTVYDKGAPADSYKMEWTDEMVPVADRLVPLTVLGRALGEAVETRVKPWVKKRFAALPASLRARLLRLTRYDPAPAR